MSAVDLVHLARAIRLAARGELSCAPNPQVGCVLVRDGVVVGEGWHQQAGSAHAEINALAAAGDGARGSTAYVSLEPCNHQGRTGPCAQALIAAGVARVVYAVADTGTKSAGGAGALQAAGMEVVQGGLEAEARALNPGFHRTQAGGLPWLRLKIAQSLDGRTALPDGRSQWITGDAARADGHRWRARSAAVITGIGTVLADDPQLNVRLPTDSSAPLQQPMRVVLDTQVRTPATARVRADSNYLLIHGSPELRGLAPENHCAIANSNYGLDLRACLVELARRGCNEILLETGPTLSGAFLAAGLVDEVLLYTAACFIGEGRPAAELGVLSTLAQRYQFQVLDHRRLGADSRIIARPQQRDLQGTSD